MLNELIAGFSQRVSELETDRSVYVRIKQGKTRKRSDVVISGIHVIDAGSLADELEGRLVSLRPDPDEKIYVEAMEKGSSHCFDCLHLKPDDLMDPDDEEFGGVQQDAIGAAFMALAGTVERLAISADTRASQSNERFLAAMQSTLELQAIAIEAETRLEMVDESAKDGAFNEAAGIFGPLIPAVLEKLSNRTTVETTVASETEKTVESVVAPLLAPETAAPAADLMPDANNPQD